MEATSSTSITAEAVETIQYNSAQDGQDAQYAESARRLESALVPKNTPYRMITGGKSFLECLTFPGDTDYLKLKYEDLKDISKDELILKLMKIDRNKCQARYYVHTLFPFLNVLNEAEPLSCKTDKYVDVHTALIKILTTVSVLLKNNTTDCVILGMKHGSEIFKFENEEHNKKNKTRKFAEFVKTKMFSPDYPKTIIVPVKYKRVLRTLSVFTKSETLPKDVDVRVGSEVEKNDYFFGLCVITCVEDVQRSPENSRGRYSSCFNSTMSRSSKNTIRMTFHDFSMYGTRGTHGTPNESVEDIADQEAELRFDDIVKNGFNYIANVFQDGRIADLRNRNNEAITREEEKAVSPETPFSSSRSEKGSKSRKSMTPKSPFSTSQGYEQNIIHYWKPKNLMYMEEPEVYGVNDDDNNDDNDDDIDDSNSNCSESVDETTRLLVGSNKATLLYTLFLMESICTRPTHASFAESFLNNRLQMVSDRCLFLRTMSKAVIDWCTSKSLDPSMSFNSSLKEQVGFRRSYNDCLYRRYLNYAERESWFIFIEFRVPTDIRIDEIDSELLHWKSFMKDERYDMTSCLKRIRNLYGPAFNTEYIWQLMKLANPKIPPCPLLFKKERKLMDDLMSQEPEESFEDLINHLIPRYSQEYVPEKTVPEQIEESIQLGRRISPEHRINGARSIVYDQFLNWGPPLEESPRIKKVRETSFEENMSESRFKEFLDAYDKYKYSQLLWMFIPEKTSQGRNSIESVDNFLCSVVFMFNYLGEIVEKSLYLNQRGNQNLGKIREVTSQHDKEINEAVENAKFVKKVLEKFKKNQESAAKNRVVDRSIELETVRVGRPVTEFGRPVDETCEWNFHGMEHTENIEAEEPYTEKEAHVIQVLDHRYRDFPLDYTLSLSKTDLENLHETLQRFQRLQTVETVGQVVHEKIVNGYSAILQRREANFLMTDVCRIFRVEKEAKRKEQISMFNDVIKSQIQEVEKERKRFYVNHSLYSLFPVSRNVPRDELHKDHIHKERVLKRSRDIHDEENHFQFHCKKKRKKNEDSEDQKHGDINVCSSVYSCDFRKANENYFQDQVVFQPHVSHHFFAPVELIRTILDLGIPNCCKNYLWRSSDTSSDTPYCEDKDVLRRRLQELEDDLCLNRKGFRHRILILPMQWKDGSWSFFRVDFAKATVTYYDFTFSNLHEQLVTSSFHGAVQEWLCHLSIFEEPTQYVQLVLASKIVKDQMDNVEISRHFAELQKVYELANKEPQQKSRGRPSNEKIAFNEAIEDAKTKFCRRDFINFQVPKVEPRKQSGMEILFAMEMVSLGIPLEYYVHQCLEDKENYIHSKFGKFVLLCLIREKHLGLPFRYFVEKNLI